MIYTKDSDNFILSCKCGCGEALSFSVDTELYESFGDYFFLTPISNGTNKDRTSVIYNIKDTFSNIFTLLKGEKVYRVGICILRSDIDYLLKWFNKQMIKAKKCNIIPEHESFESIFNNKVEYRNGENIYIELISEYAEPYELALYSTTEHNYKVRQTIRQVFREFKRNKFMMPEVALSRIGFIHFC